MWALFRPRCLIRPLPQALAGYVDPGRNLPRVPAADVGEGSTRTVRPYPRRPRRSPGLLDSTARGCEELEPQAFDFLDEHQNRATSGGMLLCRSASQALTPAPQRLELGFV